MFETLLVDVADGIASVTLNRPDRMNSFDPVMVTDLARLWHGFKSDDAVRCVVLTGAGDRAFCTGIDRAGVPASAEEFKFDPFAYEDPGTSLGPKSCGLWKPVIAAVNGMACGGAFYLLGEVEFIVAAEHATFFDPHLTYGMAAIYEPTQMAARMPFGEVMRMTLLGNRERMSAGRAYEIGLVSEVVTADALAGRAAELAAVIAAAPLAAVQATVRNLWLSREPARRYALDVAPLVYVAGASGADIEAGQSQFASGQRVEPWIR